MKPLPLLALLLCLALLTAAPLQAANSPPTITTPAYATPATATGTTSILRVAANDAAGASTLVYTWSVAGTPPAAVTFSANGTNAARTTTARFTAPGTYNFLVTVTDPAQLTATSSVSMTVVDTPTSMALTPVTVRLNPGVTQSFSAIIKDQFGVVLSPQPAISWTAAGGTVSSSGLYAAGSTPGGPFTLTATAGALSKTATITINAPPSVATPAVASANPVAGTTVGLSALGADDLPASALKYTWSTVGSVPATVAFAPNGTNAAQNTIATFKKAGSYPLQCTITDGGGLTATTAVTVVVNATPTTAAITPANPRVNPNTSKSFNATVKDQFNLALSPQPSLTWSVSGGGSISSSGAFTAGATPGGPYTVSASSGAAAGSTTVIVNAPPTVATAAAASPSPVTGTTTALSTLGADDAGEPALKYTWATKGTVPAAVKFAPNGTNAAKQSTATFAKAGTYTLQCTIADGGGLTCLTTVAVNVQATATSLAVTPLSTTITTTATQAFSGKLLDQFGLAVAPQPSLIWTAGGGGTISPAGVYTAGTAPGGPFAITASGGGLTGSASITVTNAPPTIATPASASPNPVTGTTTALSILGQSVHGAGALTYSWSTLGTPPAAVAVAPNGSNAAQSATATFAAAGSYVLQCLVTDGFGGAATSSVAVTVAPTLTTIAVAPGSATVGLSGTAGFTATAADQFGLALAPQPAISWTVTGPGSIDGFGTFTAAATAGGPYTVTASDGAVSGTAQVSVVNLAPTIVTAAQASGNPVTGTSTALSVLGADDAGESSLVYAWSATGTPPGAVTFSPNGSNAAKASTATFSAAGTYNLLCTITDAANLSVTSAVSVVVVPTPATLAVTPAQATAALNSTTADYSATVQDQFGAPLANPPPVTWSLPAAAGTISAHGEVTAAAAPGGPYTVTASCQGATGTAALTVVALPPTVAIPATALADASGTYAQLSVLGADDAGESSLTYTWAVVAPAPGTASFAANGSHAAQATVATLSAPGTYTFQVTITDPFQLSCTSSATASFTVSIQPLIGTIAGTRAPAGGLGVPALLVGLNGPNQVILDAQGNAYVADNVNGRVLRIAAGTSLCTLFAGSPTGGSDGLPATAAYLARPVGVCLDGRGHLDIADFNASRIRQVDLATGIISTVAGAGYPGTGGDGGPAVSAVLNQPAAVVADASGNLFIADYAACQVRRVDAQSGIITTIAGSYGQNSESGDGGPASQATLSGPSSLAIDASGTLYVGDYNAATIRRIDAATGIITTILASPQLGGPNGLCLDAAGGLIIADYNRNLVSRLDQSGTLRVIAGSGAAGFAGDGQAATLAQLNGPSGPAVDALGNILVCDRANNVIRLITTGPVIAAPASASQNPVLGTSVALTVLGNAAAGEGGLAYSWSTVGPVPAPVAFSASGTNAAKQTTATFAAAGSYILQAAISDGSGRTALSPIQITVVANPGGPITVVPAQATLPLNGAQSFSVIAPADQFGNAITGPAQWTVTGGGSIDGTGMFQAGASPGGPYTVSATLGQQSAAATVTIVNQPPSVAAAAQAAPNPTTTAATTLSVLGADDGGEANLTYTWSLVGAAPGTVTFLPNRINASKVTTATFSAPGTYAFQVIIADAFGLTASSTVTVGVIATFSRIVVAPSTMFANPGSMRAFTATALDQFGTAIAQPLSVTWALSGGGAIDAQGNLTADSTPGGPYVVTASQGAIMGTASLTVQAVPPVAQDQDLSVAAGTPTPLQLLASDANEDALTYAIVSPPAHGAIAGTPPMLIYTPAAGYLGPDALAFTASDAQATSPVATVSIHVYGQVNPQNRQATLLIQPASFDAARWASDAAYRTTYLAAIEPSRVWLSAVSAPGIPALVAVGPRHLAPAAFATQAIVARGAPGAPVSFAINGDGSFLESHQNSVTVLADATGTAQATYQAADGGRVGILAGSPLAIGQVRWFVTVIPAAPANPAVPQE